MDADALRPSWDARARLWGSRLVALGALILLAGMFLTPPVLNIGLAAGIAGLLLLRPPLWRWPVVIAGAALAAWILLSVLLAVLRDQPAAGRIPGTVYNWLAIPIVAVAAADAAWRRLALRIVLAVAGFAVLIALLQWTLGSGDDAFLRIRPEGKAFTRTRGLSDLSLTFGFVCSLLAVISLAPGRELGQSAWWAWTARTICAFGVLTCGARGALAGGIAGVSAALGARGRRWLIGGIIAGLVLTGIGLGAVMLKSERRFKQMISGENGRWAIWAATAEIIKDHPVVGIGGRPAYQAAYNEAYARAAPPIPNEFAKDGGPHAHNTILAFVAEHGPPAALLHLALIGTVLVATWRRRRESPGAWQAACGIATVGLVAGMVEPYASRSVPGLGFHACLGFALGMALTRTEQAPTP
ncbi:MAG: O-antigen ligase family protein [Planctomycetes bacterium]|nr:O-antigen ligase family protein [Planctomycetota bacterium]